MPSTLDTRTGEPDHAQADCLYPAGCTGCVENAPNWSIASGTNNEDGRLVGTYSGAQVASAAFLSLGAYVALTTGVQDAWAAGDVAIVHDIEDRWIILRAGDQVSDAEVEVVMKAIAPFIARHARDESSKTPATSSDRHSTETNSAR
ncbi:hypothetical protein ACW9HR_38285 [Nocardia gipuzkoensis]